MKKGKIFKTLAIFGACLSAPLMLTGCQTETKDSIEFKVADGYIQYYDGTTWKNLIEVETLKGLPGEDGDDADVWTIGNDGYWYKNCIPTNKKAVGTDGVKGNGIKNIVMSDDPSKTNATKTTYIITLDDNTTYELVVTNGTDGEKGADGKDATYSTYTITYDYGVASNLFNATKPNDTVKSTEWFVGLPTIKTDFAESFKGWFITGTNKQVEDYDFIGGNVTLEARFDITKNVQSGLYQNGKYVKTWNDLREYYADAAITDTSITYGDYGYSYFAGKDGRNAIEGELVVDDSILTIESSAFNACTKLTAIYLPINLSQVNANAFRDCSNLEDICINSKNEKYTSVDGVLYNKEKTELVAYPTKKEIAFIDSITSIQDAVFASREDIITIELPTSVKTLGASAFSGCENLTEIYIHENITNIEQQCFYGCKALDLIIIDSDDIANGLITDVNNSYSDCLLKNATKVYIKSGLETKDSVYLLGNYTKQTTSDKDGYDMYVKNS